MADHKRLFAVAKKALACFVHGVMRGFGADLLDDGIHARQEHADEHNPKAHALWG